MYNPAMQNNKQTGFYLILGMHRSGTSCLAASLEQLGLNFGGHGRQGSVANQRGNRENRAVVIFHETVLRANGGSWSAPPTQVQWQPRHYARAQELLSEYHQPFSAFKDPRTLLHWRHWLSVIPAPRIAAIVRHPQAVARSLAARDAMPLEQGLALWLRYNSELLALTEQQPVSLFDFDTERDLFSQQLHELAQLWRLPPVPEENEFLLAELRRHQPQGALDEACQALYQTLLARVGNRVTVQK